MKFGVIGLGRFGYHVATVLAENGMDVIAVDSNEAIVASIRDQVTQAICMSVSDEASLRSIGIHEMDVVIVAMGENFAQSILATALIKKHLHVPQVITRAINDIHCEILTLVGADQVILPEKEIGIKLAHALSDPFVLLARLSKEFVIAEVEVPRSFVDEPIGSLEMIENASVSCLGLRRDTLFIAHTSNKFESTVIQAGDNLILAGNQQNIAHVANI